MLFYRISKEGTKWMQNTCGYGRSKVKMLEIEEVHLLKIKKLFGYNVFFDLLPEGSKTGNTTTGNFQLYCTWDKLSEIEQCKIKKLIQKHFEGKYTIGNFRSK